VRAAPVYRRAESGSAALEIGLMVPWIVFSFMAVLNVGFCTYGMIATQNAARIAAAWGSANSTNAGNIASNACTYAAPQFKYAPRPLTACGADLSVSTSTSTVGSLSTVQVSVTYTVPLMAIPGIMPTSLAITRTVKMAVR